MDPAKSVSLRNILLSLRHPSVWPEDSFYISDSDLFHTVTVIDIRNHLQQCGLISENIDGLAEQIYSSALKVFCILVLLEAGIQITKLINIGLVDTQLPIELAQEKLKNVAQTTSSLTWDINEGRGLEKLLHLFARTQWIVLCPTFPDIMEHYVFDRRTVLPIAWREKHERRNDEVQVESVAIDKKHLGEEISRLAKTSPSRVKSSNPIQQLVQKVVFKCYQHKRPFEAELRMLHACRPHKHKHIIDLLTSFSLGTLHYLVLPLATEDLHQFWRRQNTIVDDFEDLGITWWMLQQTRGLVDALGVTHHKLQRGHKQLYGIHGDIKASNVLVFAANDLDSFGTLKWTDFGMAVLYEDPISADNAIPMGSVGTHESPECHLHQVGSQKSDMWALGCLILEFVIWCTDGIVGLDAFDLARLQTDHGYGYKFVNDYFFSLASTSMLDQHADRSIDGVNQHILEYVQEMRSRVRDESLHHVLDLVQGSLLQVNPDKRILSDDCCRALERIISSRQTEYQCLANTSLL